jgi:hypothetical protein
MRSERVQGSPRRIFTHTLKPQFLCGSGRRGYETGDVWMVPRRRLPILKRFSESRRVGPFTDNSRPVFTTEAQRK